MAVHSRKSIVLCPLPPGRKGRLSMVLKKFSYSAFCIPAFPVSSLGNTVYIRYISVRKKKVKFLVTLKLPFFREQGTCKQENLMAQHKCILLNLVYTS